MGEVHKIRLEDVDIESSRSFKEPRVRLIHTVGHIHRSSR